MGILVFVGFVLLAGFAFDRQMCLAGLRNDLSAYLDNTEEVVRIAEGPVLIHYKAVVFAVSTIYNSYFPARI